MQHRHIFHSVKALIRHNEGLSHKCCNRVWRTVDRSLILPPFYFQVRFISSCIRFMSPIWSRFLIQFALPLLYLFLTLPLYCLFSLHCFTLFHFTLFNLSHACSGKNHECELLINSTQSKQSRHRAFIYSNKGKGKRANKS